MAKSAKKPNRLHLDKRATLINSQTGSDDDLLDTLQTASWLSVSTQWLEIGRSKGWGPPFERLSPTTIRYRRGAIRAWLVEREYACTAAYGQKKQRRKA